MKCIAQYDVETMPGRWIKIWGVWHSRAEKVSGRKPVKLFNTLDQARRCKLEAR